MLKDPGAVPSVTLGVRWTSDDGGTTSISSAMPGTADSGATTTCNGSASPIITSSTTTGTSRSKPGIFTRTTCRTSTIPAAAGHRCRRRHAVQPAIYAVQWPERGGAPGPPWNSAAMWPAAPLTCQAPTADLPALRQLFAEQTEQLLPAHRVFQRPAGTTHRVADRLRRCRVELAALVLAADRVSSGNRLLSLDQQPAFNGNAAAGIVPNQELGGHRGQRHHHSLLSGGASAPATCDAEFVSYVAAPKFFLFAKRSCEFKDCT
jgi:hypothetical protein